MSNQDLFKQAIAEAKTIREAAIANAKEALEESLTPHLKDMLAAKLQEMEDAEEMEEIVNEEDLINNPQGETAHGNVAEAEEEEEAEEVESEEGEEEEGEEAGEAEEEEDEDVDVKDMSVEELKDLIRDIVAQEVGDEEGEEELPGEGEGEIGADDMQGVDDEEEIDINEILAELAEMEDSDEAVNEEEEMVNESLMGQVVDLLGVTNSQAEMILGVIGAMGLAGTSAIMAKVHDLALKGTFGEKAKAKAEALGKAGKAAADVTQQREEVSEEVLNESLMGQVVDLLGVTNSQAEMILGIIGAMGLTGVSAIMAKVHDLALKGTFGEKAKAKAQALGKAGKDAADVTQQRESAELEEALETIEELRIQLQEVNLLNAKLLYVNKVFKANNLTEGQKVNVVAAFDKAETVKEVKLVYETVSKNVVAKPAAIKEHKSFASKSAGTASTAGKKEVISEVNEQVARWQKLAGIIK